MENESMTSIKITRMIEGLRAAGGIMYSNIPYHLFSYRCLRRRLSNP